MSKVSTNPPVITAISQQSRFHAETLDTTLEVDLKGVTISIGQKELVSSSRLRLKNGVRYALIGRNGTGKSTLLQAIADKLIPGLHSSFHILMVSQIMDAAPMMAANDEYKVSVLQYVVQGDKRRSEAMDEFHALNRAVESNSLPETQRIVSTLRLGKLKSELTDARKLASRRSGAMGKRAREEEIKAEKKVKDAEIALENGAVELDIANQAADMLYDVTATLEILDASTTESRAASILSGLGFSQAMVDGPYTSLSGGWRSRCALAIALLIQSDILILDEPSNFMDLDTTLWLEQYLVSQDRTLVVTSHDHVFLNNVVEETILIRDKTLRYFEGTPHAYEVNARKLRKSSVKAKEALDKKKENIEESIRQGLASAKQSGDQNRLRMVKSRQKKLDERWGTETSAKGGRFKLNRDRAGWHLSSRAEMELEDLEPRVKITIPNPDKLRTLGDLVHFDNVSFRYHNAAKPTLGGVTFTVHQAGRCAFVGSNGQGKSTLAKLIMGDLVPTRGTITRHPLLRIGYFSQHSVEELSSARVGSTTTALDFFLEHFKNKGDKVDEGEARKCLGSLGLGGNIAGNTPLHTLSGGQKVRLAFSLIVHRPPSLLLLDELTTHLDYPTLQAIARALKGFSGAIVLITHDRWFSQVVIEGRSFASAGAHEDEADEDISSSNDDSDDTENGARRGQTFCVGGGKVQLLENGMMQYVKMVEQKLAKRRKAKLSKMATVNSSRKS